VERFARLPAGPEPASQLASPVRRGPRLLAHYFSRPPVV